MSALAVTPPFPTFEISNEAGQLHVAGELDLAAVPELRSRVRAAAASGGTAVLDLSRVDFIDVAGLSALSALAHEARREHWRLEVRDASLIVRQLARLCGCDSRLLN